MGSSILFAANYDKEIRNKRQKHKRELVMKSKNCIKYSSLISAAALISLLLFLNQLAYAETADSKDQAKVEAPAESPAIVVNEYVLLDSEGAPVGKNLEWLNLPLTPGLNRELNLTIRNPIQQIAEEELDALMDQYNPRRAYAIMADPATGDILALAVKQGRDPIDGMDGVVLPSSLVFEPTSMMKPFPIAAAIDLGLITPDTKFDCEKGEWNFAGKTLRDSHPEETITVSDIIRVSSNIGTAKIALKLGDEKLYKAFRSFGFAQKTGLPLCPESAGILREVKDWDPLSIARFPIGQGISCTPFQLLRAYCALANGGKLVKLRIVDGGKDPQTGKIVRIPAEAGEKILKDDTCVKMASMLKLVTSEGASGMNAAIPGYEVAGKTGTSQKWEDGQYSYTRFYASFIGFVPADKPKFGLIVIADEPEEEHFGSVVAAPAFRNIAERTLKLLETEKGKTEGK